MDKNDFLRLNEAIYHIHTAETLEDLKMDILSQVRFIIPNFAASLIEIQIDPDTKDLVHGRVSCLPERSETVWRAWIANADRDRALWISHAPESVVLRDSAVWDEDFRMSSHIYGTVYRPWGIFDTLTMNIAYQNRVLALLTFVRTREDGPFTEQDEFYLRALSNHIDYAYWRLANAAKPAPAAAGVAALAERFGLTRREEEILRLVFQDQNNDEILDRLVISRNTLLKHLQNLYRKCGVSSRWDLLKLRDGGERI